jgi:hypothetical protein
MHQGKSLVSDCPMPGTALAKLTLGQGMALPETLSALRHYLDEHDAHGQPRKDALEAYAKGDNEALENALQRVVFFGELMMEAVGHPVEEVPVIEDELTLEELEAAAAGDGEDFDPEAEGLEPYDPQDPQEPEGGKKKTRQGDEWKGDDYEDDWEKQGEDWRG